MSSANTVCSLSVYIKNNYPNFDNLLKNVCSSRLTNIRSNDGVTFVVPNEASVKTHLSGSEKLMTDQVLKAKQNFCRKHFLLGKLGSYTRPSISNAENKYLSLEKKDDKYTLSSNGKSVTIKESSIKLPIRLVKGKEEQPRVVIYEQTSGNIGEIEGSESDKVSKPAVVKGGALYNRKDIEDSIRFQHCLSLVNAHGGNFHNPYLAAVNSLLLCLKKHDESLYKKLILVKDVSPEVNFYMFVQPFCKSNHLISDKMIATWGGTLFDYRMNDLDHKFNEEAHSILQHHSSELHNMKSNNLDADLQVKSKIVGLDVETLKHMDLFRLEFRNKFRSIVPGNASGNMMTEIVKNIATWSVKTNNQDKIVDVLISHDCYCYLNNDPNVEIFETVSKTSDKHISDHFIDGFELLNGTSVTSMSGGNAYGGEYNIEEDEESPENITNQYGGIFESVL